MTYRQARLASHLALLAIIFALALFAYLIFNRQAEAIHRIVTEDEEVLRGWYAVSDIVAEAKDRLYDYQLGTGHSLAAVDLLVVRAAREAEAIRRRAGTGSPTADELLETAGAFRALLRQYREPVQPPDLNRKTLRLANRMALLGRTAVTEVSQRLEEKHRRILRLITVSQRWLVAGLAAATLVTVVISLILGRALNRPVQELVAATESLAAGDLSHRVRVAGNDEMGRLGQAFNAMAAELENSRAALVRANAYIENIVRSMINCLVVVDPRGCIETVNDATCRLLGYRPGELVGQPVSSLFAPGYYARFRFEDLLSSGAAGQQETVFATRDGGTVPMLLSGAVMTGDQGEVAGMVLVAQDITLQAEAMRAGHLAALGELAAGVAHEINNPLNAIINYAQILTDELEEDGQVSSRELLARIGKEGDRVAAIVRGLLSFAREEDKARDAVAAGDLINETLTLSDIQLRKDGVTVQVEVAPDLPVFSGHFQQLQQVLLNLVNNARYALNQKYPGRHPDKILAIRASRQEVDNAHWVAIQVEDHGTGIPEEVIGKVKNPFFSTKPRGKGTGLGLTISHGIVTAHGGRLLVESTPGSFTRVTVLLPPVAAQEEQEAA